MEKTPARHPVEERGCPGKLRFRPFLIPGSDRLAEPLDLGTQAAAMAAVAEATLLILSRAFFC